MFHLSQCSCDRKDLELAPLEPPAEHLKDGIIVRHLDLLPGAEIPFVC